MTDTNMVVAEKPAIFSPSQTYSFSFCPRFWGLRLPWARVNVENQHDTGWCLCSRDKGGDGCLL